MPAAGEHISNPAQHSGTSAPVKRRASSSKGSRATPEDARRSTPHPRVLPPERAGNVPDANCALGSAAELLTGPVSSAFVWLGLRERESPRIY